MNYSVKRLVGYCLGLPLLFFTISNMVNGKKSESWPSTDGQINISSIHNNTLELSVRYAVGVTTFECSRIEFGRRPDKRDRYRYYRDAHVYVFYDQNNPSECVLEPGISLFMIVQLVIALIFLALGLHSHSKMSSSTLRSSSEAKASHAIEEAHSLASSGKTIEAIKVYRSVTGVGLKEAKDYISNYTSKDK